MLFKQVREQRVLKLMLKDLKYEYDGFGIQPGQIHCHLTENVIYNNVGIFKMKTFRKIKVAFAKNVVLLIFYAQLRCGTRSNAWERGSNSPLSRNCSSEKNFLTITQHQVSQCSFIDGRQNEFKICLNEKLCDNRKTEMCKPYCQM